MILYINGLINKHASECIQILLFGSVQRVVRVIIYLIILIKKRIIEIQTAEGIIRSKSIDASNLGKHSLMRILNE